MYVPNYQCFDCGAPAQEKHHVIPKSIGGTKTIPLCVECHSKVHDGLGRNRISHAELTKQALNRKRDFTFAEIWWPIFKDRPIGSPEPTTKEISEKIGVDAGSVRKRVKRLKEMPIEFMKELLLPFVGYEWHNADIWNMEPFNPTTPELIEMQKIRHSINASIIQELGMQPLEFGEFLCH